MTWLLQHRFLALLLAMITLMVVYPLCRNVFDAELLFDILLTVMFAFSILAIFKTRQLRLLGVVLGIPTLVSLWTGYVVPGLPHWHLAMAFHLCAVLFIGLTVSALLLSIHKEKVVSSDGIYGAFCGYLLVGLLFGHVYCVAESINPGSFKGPADFSALVEIQDRRHFTLSYFSFVTLTTLGYGDVTPVSEGARAVAIVEAIMGQFYLAVLMAELIGKRVAHALSGN